MRRRDVLGVAAALAAAPAGLATAQAPTASPAPSVDGDVFTPGRQLVADIHRIVTPRGVQETFEATLGGVRQVINVRGADRRNPLLLFVHGGPAAVEMPVAWAFQRPWEDVFTVVQWDQRGAGRTYRLNDPAAIAPTLHPDRYRDDAIELIELLTRCYGHRKVVLLGHSWGSIVGLSVAAARPDLLHAYVGVGQVIDFRRNEEVGFAMTLAEARRRGNAQAVRELEALRPYPGAGPFNLAKLDVERRWVMALGGLAAGRDNADFYFHAGRLSPEYTLADRRAWDDGSAFTMRTMFSELADITFAPLRTLAIPTLMFLGRRDLTTPSPLAADWLNALHAPEKATIWFENSAHLPFIEEPGRFFLNLARHVAPLAPALPAAPERNV